MDHVPFLARLRKRSIILPLWLWGVVFLLPTRDCHSPANVSFLVLEMTFQSSKCLLPGIASKAQLAGSKLVQLRPWLLVITGYFYGIIHSINIYKLGFLSTYNWYNSGHNCGKATYSEMLWNSDSSNNRIYSGFYNFSGKSGLATKKSIYKIAHSPFHSGSVWIFSYFDCH